MSTTDNQQTSAADFAPPNPSAAAPTTQPFDLPPAEVDIGAVADLDGGGKPPHDAPQIDQPAITSAPSANPSEKSGGSDDKDSITGEVNIGLEDVAEAGGDVSKGRRGKREKSTEDADAGGKKKGGKKAAAKSKFALSLFSC